MKQPAETACVEACQPALPLPFPFLSPTRVQLAIDDDGNVQTGFPGPRGHHPHRRRSIALSSLLPFSFSVLLLLTSLLLLPPSPSLPPLPSILLFLLYSPFPALCPNPRALACRPRASRWSCSKVPGGGRACSLGRAACAARYAACAALSSSACAAEADAADAAAFDMARSSRIGQEVGRFRLGHAVWGPHARMCHGGRRRAAEGMPRARSRYSSSAFLGPGPHLSPRIACIRAPALLASRPWPVPRPSGPARTLPS